MTSTASTGASGTSSSSEGKNVFHFGILPGQDWQKLTILKCPFADMRGKDDENKSVQQQAKTSVSNPKGKDNFYTWMGHEIKLLLCPYFKMSLLTGYIQQQSHQQPQQASSYHNLLPLSSNNPQNMVVFQPNVPIVRSQSETKVRKRFQIIVLHPR